MTQGRNALEWDHAVVRLLSQHLATFSTESQHRLLAPLDSARGIEERRAALPQWRIEAVAELTTRRSSGVPGSTDQWRDEVLAPMAAQLADPGDDSTADWHRRIAAAVTTALEATHTIDHEDQDCWFALADALASQVAFVGLVDLSSAALDAESVSLLETAAGQQEWSALRSANLRRGIAICTALAIAAVVVEDDRLVELAGRLDVIVMLTIYLHATLDVAVGSA